MTIKRGSGVMLTSLNGPSGVRTTHAIFIFTNLVGGYKWNVVQQASSCPSQDPDRDWLTQDGTSVYQFLSPERDT